MTQPNLFTCPETKSPRLLWMEANNILTHHAEHLAGVDDADPWSAWIGTLGDLAAECAKMADDGRLAFGVTEEEALLNLVAGGRVKHWNAPTCPDCKGSKAIYIEGDGGAWEEPCPRCWT